MGPVERLGQVGEELEARLDDRAAGIEDRRVPEAELVAGRLLLADRAQQAVALLERPAVLGEIALVRRRSLAGQLVQRRPAQPRRARHEQHLLRREQHDPQGARQAAGPSGNPVDADPLALAGAVGHQRNLEGRVLGHRDVAFHAGKRPAPADHLGVRRRSMRAPPGQQHDRLEQARLAGRVGAPDELRPRPERGLERGIAPEVGEAQGVEQRGVPGRDPAFVGDGDRQDAVRTGMTTWT